MHARACRCTGGTARPVLEPCGWRRDDRARSLQADIEACDRHGGGNHDVSPDEHIEDWVACVVAAVSKEDVDLLVLPLLSA